MKQFLITTVIGIVYVVLLKKGCKVDKHELTKEEYLKLIGKNDHN